jgi:hypothetical protein
MTTYYHREHFDSRRIIFHHFQLLTDTLNKCVFRKLHSRSAAITNMIVQQDKKFQFQ